MICTEADCTNRVLARGWCSRHYNRWRKYGSPGELKRAPNNMTADQALRHRGWTVTKAGCWEWAGTIGTRGYGGVTVSGKQYGVHRLAYETWVGPIPDGLLIRHDCDNPPCINPAHLKPGTEADNKMDMRTRKRSSRIKLSEQDVVEIRTEYAKGVLTQKMLAGVYGVSRGSIQAVVSGRNWGDIK